MTRVLIDNNCIDTLRDNEEMYAELSQSHEFLVSSSVVEELAGIPDTKKEIRIQTFLAFSKAQVKFVTDAVAVWDVSRWNYARWPEERTIEVYEKILNKEKSNIRDAIIAATAVMESCILLTNDTKLTTKMKNNNYAVMSFSELYSIYQASKGDTTL